MARSSFAILAANPTSPTTATVLLGPLSSGKPRSYSVRACLQGAPSSCKALQCTFVSCGPLGVLASGKRYTITANATLASGSRVRASNTLVLAMPATAAPVLLSANPVSLTKGRATAVPPSTGACSNYFWVFSLLGSGNQVNATTTTLTATTAAGSLVPGGVYEAKVACVRSGRAAAAGRSLRQTTLELGPFSNALRFVMPAPGAPVMEAKATGATTAAATIQPPPGFTQRFELTVCALGGSCRKVPCTTPANCALTGLDPGTTHSVTAVAFNAAGAASAVSNAATFTTCPADRPLACGGTCIAANSCCNSEPGVGTRCAAPLTCPADGKLCGEQYPLLCPGALRPLLSCCCPAAAAANALSSVSLLLLGFEPGMPVSCRHWRDCRILEIPALTHWLLLPPGLQPAPPAGSSAAAYVSIRLRSAARQTPALVSSAAHPPCAPPTDRPAQAVRRRPMC